jgi:arylsulfatase A-like enzyme
VLRERYAEITAMDRAIGKLRGYLQEQGLSENTIFWYVGDNGIPTSGRATTPFRGQKGDVYEGGVRVPGVIEWPAGIPRPRVTDAPAVTSDMLPTLCAAVGAPLPDRPLDGIDLMPLIAGEMAERPSPICFWSYPTRRVADAEPYIDPSLQEGTTPLAKLMDGKATRRFRNVHQPPIAEEDYGGERAILDNRYKLVMGADAEQELFDMSRDEGEQTDIAGAEPEVAAKLARELWEWQESVLRSLTGADYA